MYWTVIFEHVNTLDFEDPTFLERLLDLEEKLTFFEHLKDLEALIEERITKFTLVYQEVLDLFQVKLKYFLIKDNEEQSVYFCILKFII